MKSITRSLTQLFIGMSLVVGLGNAQATILNGDFQTGDLSSWSTYTTANGTLGTGRPTVSAFDVAGSGLSSSALGLSVGYHIAPCAYPGSTCPLPTEGGGIRQTATFLGGLTTLHVDVAVANAPSLYGGYNLDGGTFSLLLDGVLLDTVSIGQINAGSVLRDDLAFTTFVSAGSHTFDIFVTRQHAEARSLTQYIDNVSVSVTAIPEPATSALLGIGLMAVFARGRKRSSTEA